MKEAEILRPVLFFKNNNLSGDNVETSTKKIADVQEIYANKATKELLDKITYEVTSFLPVKEGDNGGLYFGITYIQPGKVGNEYFMTRGHFHSKINAAEYYWGLQGEGVLLLMDTDRNLTAQRVIPGSLHYIPGGTAHRMVNTGDTVFSFAACWPANAGHNYDEISKNGFSMRLIEQEGKPVLIKA